MDIRATINDRPTYFGELSVGDMFVYTDKTGKNCILVKIYIVYNADGTAMYNALPITTHCGYPEYFNEMEKVTKAKDAKLTVSV